MALILTRYSTLNTDLRVIFCCLIAYQRDYRNVVQQLKIFLVFNNAIVAINKEEGKL